MQIDGRVVLITGASEGIGAACAASFRRRGARLSLVARNETKLAEVGGTDALITAGDLTDPKVREAAVNRTVARFGRIDVLVNNAGIGLYAPAWNAPMEEVRRLVELNYFVPLALTQLVVPHMRKQASGTVVNVSSIAGQAVMPWFTLYSSTKFALCAMTDGLRMELKRDGIHAMAVCPGYVQTAFQSHVLGGKPPVAIALRKRFAITAEECAEALVRGVERDRRLVVTPRSGWFVVWAARFFPALVEARLEAMLQGGER